MAGDGGAPVDLLSSLPDDVLHAILLRLCSAEAAARTSLLARRWRHLWTHLPELEFESDAKLAAVQAALTASAAPAHDLHGGMGWLKVVAPRLRVLDVCHCFVWRTYGSKSLVWDPPYAAVIAPVLEDLIWVDAFDPSSVKFAFGKAERLQKLVTLPIKVYEHPRCTAHMNSIRLLQRFETVSVLKLELNYPKIMGGRQYLMEAITKLPAIEILSLQLSTRGHTFGHCVFHLLKMSTGIRKLELTLNGDYLLFLSLQLFSLKSHLSHVIVLTFSYNRCTILSAGLTVRLLFHLFQAKTCSGNCICNQSQDWKTEEIFLESLREVKISGLRRSEHELAFVEQLFGWAAVLKTFKVHLHRDLTVSDDLCKELLSLGTPDTDVKIYFYHAKTWPPWVLYTPVEYVVTYLSIL
uniref:F-box domain-containing protein n=1 Tax=Leersia perrieri TaxID=77586 RepID=A0A0D9WWY0_9ORYZ